MKRLPSPLRDPRRIAAAAVVTLLLVGGTIGVVGMASAGDGSTAFSLPARHTGDTGTYTIVVEGPQGGVGRMHFEWLPPDLFKDGEGIWRAAEPMRMEYEDSGRDGRAPIHSQTLHVDAAEMVVVAQRAGSAAGSTSQSTGTFELFSFGGTVPCGSVNTLQGAAGGPRDRVAVLCAEGERTFRVAGVEQIDGGEARVLESVDGGPPARLWFLAGIPYPVRSVEEREQDGETVRVERHLTAFQRGAAQPGVPQVPAAEPLPPVGAAARGPYGPDWSGIDHPYPLEEAVRQARADPDFPDLREYLERNPEAYIRFASYFQGPADNGETRGWWFIYSAEAESIQVGYGVYERDRVHELGGLPIVGDALRQRSAVFHAFLYEGSRGPAPEDLPRTLPPLRDVVAAWAAYAERPREEGFRVGFELGLCGPAPCSGEPVVWAGDLNDASWTACCGIRLLPAEEERHEGALRLALGLDGTPAWVAFGASTFQHRDVTDALPGGGPGESVGDTPRAGTAAAAVPWSQPTTEAAAGLTVAALLAGLVYWGWPWLKASPLVLGRVGGSRLLRHPRRRRIVEAVEKHPGIHFQGLRARTGIPNGTLVHHVQKLVDGGVLVARKGSGRTCYFAGRPDRRLLEAAPVLCTDGARRVLLEVLRRPGTSAGEVARATGLSPGTVSHHLGRLRAAGLVTSLRRGPGLAVHPTDAARAVARPSAA